MSVMSFLRPPPPRRVAIISRAPFLGGAEVAAQRLATGLSETGCHVVCVLGQEGDAAELMRQSGLDVRIAAMPTTDRWHWLRYSRARYALRSIFKKDGITVAHANDLPSHQIASDAVRGLPIARVCHHRFLYDAATTRWLLKFGAERHLFVSRGLQELLYQPADGQGMTLEDVMPAERCGVVYDGLPLPVAPTPGQKREARRQRAIDPDHVVAVFTGQVIERKGVAELLRAWALLERRVVTGRAAAELIIVGDDLAGHGEYLRRMKSLARELGIDVRFAGFQKDVAEWLTAADFAVAPSHFDPLGNAVLEAMAVGLPVIGAEVGGIPEMIDRDETGLLVPPRDPHALAHALRTLILNPELRQRLGRTARRRCEERFSLRQHARAVLDEYQVAERGLHHRKSA
ncbi:MAG: glycosyltransferase family 4 protein [Phycisphaeraceae bacterium]|nr:glycosyltransferase family 4 protein [Phycisphaeraceae bacterium]